MVEDAISFWTDIQRYENMLAADPRSYCFVPLSELYRKLGLLDDAISVAAKGCGMHPDYPGGFFALGAAYNAKGEKDEARNALERTIDLKPDHLLALKMLGEVYVEQGSLDLAENVLRLVLAEDPQDTQTALLLRSIASQPEGAPQPAVAEEELLEEVDLVEELTDELVEQEPAGGTFAIEFELAGVDDYHAAAHAPASLQETPAKGDQLSDSGDLWAIGDSAETEPGAADTLEDDELFAFEEEAPASPAAAPSGQGTPAGRDPLATPTMAELYVSQGFIDKALAIYSDLAAADPANQSYRARVEDLKRTREQQAAAPLAAAPAAQGAAAWQAPAQQPVAQSPSPAHPASTEQAALAAGAGTPELDPAGPLELEGELSRWLQNIRRRRDGV